MKPELKRQKFIEKAQTEFAYLVSDFGYVFKGIKSTKWADKLSYENKEADRLIILSNQYHPSDDGFEIQLYRPSVSTDHAEREMPIHRLKEDQHENQEYLAETALELRENYEAVITGKSWRPTLRESFDKELEKVRSESVLSPEYRKRKTILWTVRTLLAAVLYFIFWKYEWVRWSLVVYIPLNLFGLLSIYGWNYILKRKIDKTTRAVSEAERVIRESDNL